MGEGKLAAFDDPQNAADWPVDAGSTGGQRKLCVSLFFPVHQETTDWWVSRFFHPCLSCVSRFFCNGAVRMQTAFAGRAKPIQASGNY